MKKTNALSNKASLGTYLTLALSAGAHSLASHSAHAGIVISTVNETSINSGDPIFINFSNGVISSGRGAGISGSLGTLTGVSGFGKNVDPPRIVFDAATTDPARPIAR